MNTKPYDVIFIGSGMGSLSAASLLAQWEKKRCLILEKHWQIGGYTHVFRRKKKYAWDVGLHYVGQIAPGEQIRRVFDTITEGKLRWHMMPDIFDKFVFPGLTFGHRTGVKNFQADLQNLFPEEAQALDAYFKDIEAVLIWFQRLEVGKNLPRALKWVAPLIQKNVPFALQTTAEYLRMRFRNETLRGIVASQWGDFGLPPSKSAFCIHAMVVNHFFSGAAYPVGTSETIAGSIIPIIEAKGGKVLANHAVQDIIVENGKAVGVKVKNLRPSGDGKKETELTFKARIIVSCAGVYNTYVKLLKTSETKSYKEGIIDFNKRNPPVSHMSVYIALKESARKLGFAGENHWIYDTLDHDETFARRIDWLNKGRPPMVFLSLPSMKDPRAEGHTAEVMTFAPYGEYEKWKDQPWHKREEAYKKLKARAAGFLIDFVEERYPGFADLVDFYEVSTPITTEYMTSHNQGSIYGLASVPERYDAKKSPWCQVRTPIRNLYLTGADATSLGISGAMMGGVATCAHLMKPWHLPKLLRLV